MEDDRDAILKRRARLIGLALSGLASTAGCDGVPFGACLEAPNAEVAEQAPTPPGEAAPQEAAPPEPEPPAICLSVTETQDDEEP